MDFQIGSLSTGKSALELSSSSNDNDDSRLEQNVEENIPDITMDDEGNYCVVSGDDCNNKDSEESRLSKEEPDSVNNENQQGSDIRLDLKTSVNEKIIDSIQSESQTVSDAEKSSGNKSEGHESIISNGEQSPGDKLDSSTTGGEQVQKNSSESTLDDMDNANGQQEEKESDLEPLDILGNGMLLKKVVKPAENPDSRPSYGDQVTLKTEGTLEDGSLVDKHDSITFTLGDGDVIQAWDLCCALMGVGEVCQLTTDSRYAYGSQGRSPSIPANSKITYTLELLKKDEPVDLAKLSVDNRIKFGNEKRERGNYLFGRGDYTGAINSYSKALKILNDDNLSHSEEASVLQQLVDTRMKCYNNIAAAQIKVEAYAAAIKSCDEVLKVQPQNIKALFRKGKALASKGNTELAITVLKRAVQLDPESKIVQQELFKQTKKLKKETESEKEMYRKMFGSPKVPAEEKKKPENAVYRWTSWGLAVIGGTAAFLVSGAIALYRSLRG